MTSTNFSGVFMGMGNPLLDISSDVPQEVLDKYGFKLNNAILAEAEHLPIYKELVDKYSPQYIGGGATQNSIRVAQWMLTSANMLNATAFMGCIGKDEFGDQLAACAKADGVLAHYMVDEGAATGTCAVLINGGERSLVANLAAANNFKPSHLETDLAKEIYTSAKYYYIAGFFLTVSVESLQIIGEHAVAENKVFALNLSAPFIISFFSDQVATALKYADYLFCNESEAEEYGKKHELGSDLKEIALTIAKSPKANASRDRTVVFTQGSSATIVVHKGVVTEYPVEPLAKELLVDTNGAGDAFVGGFMAQLVQGKDIAECVKAAHWAARYVIQQSGTTLPGPCEYKA